MSKIIMSGNEAVARGAYEAGCHVAAAYPGTKYRNTENIGAHYKMIFTASGHETKK
jgi:pyruvate/2-oxoacid:ferredoxin oxidoreductase alpha subunit